MLSDTGSSGSKNRILLPLLTSYDFQGAHDQGIDELNLPCSRWISEVASTGFPAQITTGNNEVYLVTQHRFCAYLMNDGAQLWCTHTQPQQGYYSEEFEQTVFMNGIAYVGRGLWIPDGLRIEAWDANKGTLHWAWPANVSLLSHDLSWLFAGSNGILYVPVMQGIYAIRGSDGHQLWFATLNMGWGPIVPAP